MFLRVTAMVAAATLAAACALTLPSRGAAAACGNSGYSYAGVSSVQSRSGVSAAITSLSAPRVTAGHVAAWVGVGGAGLGPNGSDEWLQVGISAKPGQGSALYYELALPGKAVRYVMLAGHLPVGRSYRVAVLESAAGRGLWRVWVNGSPVTKPIHLAGSHNAWRPVATSESWDGGSAVCNAFAFRFADVHVASHAGGGWTPMESEVWNAPGYVVQQRTPAGFVARGGV
jgi:hypothetical protein